MSGSRDIISAEYRELFDGAAPSPPPKKKTKKIIGWRNHLKAAKITKH